MRGHENNLFFHIPLIEDREKVECFRERGEVGEEGRFGGTHTTHRDIHPCKASISSLGAHRKT